MSRRFETGGALSDYFPLSCGASSSSICRSFFAAMLSGCVLRWKRKTLRAPILFADEPTSALDVSVQRQVVKEMLKLRELFGTAIVIVTHDIGVVRAMADTVLVLKNGKAVEYGAAEIVLDHPQDPYTKKLLEAVPKLKRKVRV